MPQATIPFGLQIDPEAVNRMVVKAILDSAIGIKIKEGVEDAVKKMTTVSGYGYTKTDPISEVATQVIRKDIQQVIETEFKDVIREKVRAALTDQFTDAAISAMVKNLWKDR